jgi:hypothetical protein
LPGTRLFLRGIGAARAFAGLDRFHSEREGDFACRPCFPPVDSGGVVAELCSSRIHIVNPCG